MVAFVTLFLGLFLGARDVTLAVGADVARVEMRLDGETVAALEGPPWRAVVDFGEELAPHDLVAVAFDAKGRELGRARQRINRPRSDAEATLVLQKGAHGRGSVARLSWTSITAETPLKVSVTFDGKPLEVSDPRRIELPPYVPEQLHFLRAELDFPENATAVAEITFGGRYKDEALAELTALPVVLESVKRLPPAEALAGWFTSRGEELRPVAVEEGPAEVVFVLDESARRPLEAIRSARLVTESRRHPMHDPQLRHQMTFRKDQRFRFLWPVSIRRRVADFEYDLFLRSEDFTRNDGGFLYLVTHVRRPAGPDAAQRLADAVAVAGLSAVDRERRRAVVLLLGPNPDEESKKNAAETRRYLARLAVPFQTWCLDPAAVERAAEWGGCTDASRFDLLDRAVTRLSRDLEKQRIVWLAGIHQPSAIELTPRSAGIALAGAAAAAIKAAGDAGEAADTEPAIPAAR